MLNATEVHRFGHWCLNKRIPILPRVCGFINRRWNQCILDSRTILGQNVVLAHSGMGICIHWYSKIGDNVRIAQFVTIGGRSRHKSTPVIEDNVYIGPGAMVLGAITIGKGSIVGANAVVINDVPPNCIVAGVPAKIIKHDIDKNDFI
jgi:serine O-acetyltransferase